MSWWLGKWRFGFVLGWGAMVAVDLEMPVFTETLEGREVEGKSQGPFLRLYFPPALTCSTSAAPGRGCARRLPSASPRAVLDCILLHHL
ncbi:hypothetical protein BDY21DRAFT_351455 [Lineolata rhizophorae]|uniref:Major facilitator superfamily (MFS) profile domain-containing protein n=1 Tax=Lineolata rhizophorae TaxID=578093 RepID=A0A6A6NUR0_9PEZI|nr:hypothetical protein BDY21DRAFT_351455 [Lineolata rhizophorae]